jgi:Uma2 family endonuclease
MVQLLTSPPIQLHPGDHGREMSLEDFERAIYEDGHHYELIEGRIYVSTMPDPPQDSIEMMLLMLLSGYRFNHPEVINHVTNKSRVFVPGVESVTCPEPDIAAFHEYPHDRARHGRLRWNEVSPVLVVEVVSQCDPKKNLGRNVDLYERVPSIREYWIVSDEEETGFPSLLVYRRRGKNWQKPIAVAPGRTYSTRLLPGFELKLEAPPEE